MKKILRTIVIVSAVTCMSASAGTDPDTYFMEFKRDMHGVEMRIDPRIELFQILNMVGGNPAVNVTQMDYKNAIFEYFEDYRDHPAFNVARAKCMAVFKDIDAPYRMLIALNNDFTFRADLQDNYWADNQDVQELLRALRQLMVATDFVRFFNGQAQYYNLLLDNTAFTLCDFNEKNRMLNYLGVGNPEEHTFYIVLNALGFGNFGKGVSTQRSEEHYAIVSPGSGNGVMPFFKECEILELFWHEAGHSFINPLINDHWEEFESLSDLYEPIKASMSGQYYPDWKSTCYEHLVRAVVCRLSADRFGEAYADVNQLRRELGQKFIYTECIVDALKTYEMSREQYPSLADFMPQILSALKEIDTQAVDTLLTRAIATRAPDLDDIPSIGDIYGKDKVLVICATQEEDAAANERLINYVKSTHGRYEYTTDTEALEMDLSEYHLFVIGTPWGNRFLRRHLPELPIQMTPDGLIAGSRYDGTGYAFISGWVNPANPKKAMVIYTAQHPDDLINFTWIPRGDTDYMVVQHLIPLRADDYRRFNNIWTCY